MTDHTTPPTSVDPATSAGTSTYQTSAPALVAGSIATPASRVARTGLIAGVYAAASVLAMQALSVLAWGPIQFRISEALVILPLFFVEAVPGLALGCFLANLINVALTGSGALGLLDVAFGTLATLVGALWTRRFRKKSTGLALAGPVVTNALIVAAYLPIILKGLGYYTIPFTAISLDNSWIWMYAFGVLTIAAGEAAVVYALGLPLAHVLRKRFSR